jgi:DNA-binding transcriptional ArsR family regulator
MLIDELKWNVVMVARLPSPELVASQKPLKKKPVLLSEIFESRGRVKILETLVPQELNISEIARRVKLNHNSVSYHLKTLTEAGILQEKTVQAPPLSRFK